jgi:hypothetical protein
MRTFIIFVLLSLISFTLFGAPLAIAGEKPKEDKLRFSQGENGSFYFNTGVVKGVLRLGGKSTGLFPVTYIPDSLAISAGEGLFNHYRVFTYGKRYGYGARRWPSTAELLSDGSVEVIWQATPDRPFELRAIYQLVTPNSIDLVTIVKSNTRLEAFEVFLASYFDTGFTDSQVYAKTDTTGVQKMGFVSADRELGDWLAFPRDAEAEKVIGDGRWELEPHPIKWTMMPDLGIPIAFRRDTHSGLTVIMMAKRGDCFGIFTPYGEEKHYSSYLSLFGYDIEEGETASTHTRMVILKNSTEEEILEIANIFQKLMQ